MPDSPAVGPELVSAPPSERPAHPRLLLTGATGYLGSAFLPSALETFAVRCLGRSQKPEATSQKPERGDSPSPISHIPQVPRSARVGGTKEDLPSCSFFPCDLTTDPIPPEALDGVDVIVHLAGKAHALEERPGEEEESYRVITVEGTRKLLKAAKAHGVKRFVFASTVKVYPENPPEILDETAPTGPETPYGKTKLEAEDLVLRGGFVPEPVVLRFSMIYGGRETGNMEKMEEAIRRNRFPPIPEFGNKRSMVHIDDAVQALLLASGHKKAPGEIFNVTDGDPISTRELYLQILEKLDRQPPRWTIPRWALKCLALVGDGVGKLRGRRFVFDSDALRKLTGNASFSSEKIQRDLGFCAKRDVR